MKLLDAGPSERGWHRIQNVIRCPRLFAWREIGGKRFKVSAPLVNGSLIHVALAHHYQRLKEKQTGGNPDDWLLPEDAIVALAEKNADESPLWMSAIPQIQDAYFAYRHNWHFEEWKVLDVEHQLKARLGEKKHLYTQISSLKTRMEECGSLITSRLTDSTLKLSDSTFLMDSSLGINFSERLGMVLSSREFS
jgi:hypothetical protein